MKESMFLDKGKDGEEKLPPWRTLKNSSERPAPLVDQSSESKTEKIIQVPSSELEKMKDTIRNQKFWIGVAVFVSMASLLKSCSSPSLPPKDPVVYHEIGQLQGQYFKTLNEFERLKKQNAKFYEETQRTLAAAQTIQQNTEIEKRTIEYTYKPEENLQPNKDVQKPLKKSFWQKLKFW